MRRKAKRSFVLKNFKSRFVKPAVFTVEDNFSEAGDKSDVVLEAEKIIDSYLKKMGYAGMTVKKNGVGRGAFVGFTVIFSLAALILLIVRYM